MNGLKAGQIVALAVATVSLSACATMQPGPDITRPNFQAQAAVYIEPALTKPMADLYSDAQGPDVRAGLRYALALLAGRSPELTPEDQADFITLAALERRLAGKTSSPSALTAREQLAMERLRMRWSPDGWMDRAVRATTTRTLMIYQPPVRLGGSGSLLPITVSDPVVPFGVAMTAAHCANAVRLGAGFGPVAVHGSDGVEAQWQAALDAELKADDPARQWSSGAAACGPDTQYLTYIRLRQGR